MKPSNFTSYPWDSITKKAECETVATNIMVILKRTGDYFRELTYDEYKKERLKDGNYSDSEEQYYERVIKYCINENTSKLFCKDWADKI